VCLSNPKKKVHFYTDDAKLFSDADKADADKALLAKLHCEFEQHPLKDLAAAPENEIAVVINKSGDLTTEVMKELLEDEKVDAVVTPYVLYIRNVQKIKPAEVLTIRKRMATPTSNPMSMHLLQQFIENSTAGVPECPLPAPAESWTEEAEFYSHLQTLSGTVANPECNPVVFTAGLPCICAIYYALVQGGGADLLMCSTAYGGSNQVTDLMEERTGLFTKHTFDIQQGIEKVNIDQSVSGALDNLAKRDNLFPTTVLFVEIPTNPDMKVPDMAKIAAALKKYQETTEKKVMLLIDTTFAPPSKVLQQIKEEAAELPAMVFISMSKSISQGKTTAGVAIANHTEESTALCHKVRDVAQMLDTEAKPEQMQTLCENHTGVEERCQNCYQLTKRMSEYLVKTVQDKTGDQEFNVDGFVSEANAAKGFTSSTFSFNLPVPDGAPDAVTEVFAQKFVDYLVRDAEFMKPCVSFGQNNGKVYCTVPATSTQGAVKAEDKAKQAVGGVQLVRLSFPVSVSDEEKVKAIMGDAVELSYDWAAAFKQGFDAGEKEAATNRTACDCTIS